MARGAPGGGVDIGKLIGFWFAAVACWRLIFCRIEDRFALAS
jgi:hypothetical protein